MRGDTLGIASTHFYSHIRRDPVSVYCLSCARRIYGEGVIDRVLAEKTLVVPVALADQGETEQHALTALRDGVDVNILYQHQYCQCQCDLEDPEFGRALCPGKSHRDYARDVVRSCVEDLESQCVPITVQAIYQACDYLIASGRFNVYVQTFLEELYPDRYPPDPGEEVMLWLDDSSLVWSNADFLHQYDKWKYRTEFPNDGNRRALRVPKGEEVVIERWLHSDGPIFKPPFPDRHP
jgi:hypothetical protein